MLTLDDLNKMDPARFATALANVFEHAPWIAQSAVTGRPFAHREALHAAMVEVMRAAPRARQMALICGHPELAGKAMVDRRLTAESSREQKGSGLDRLTQQEFDRLHALNDAYRRKFGFPFILAIKGKDKHEIIAAIARRLEESLDAEFANALDEIAKIAGFRLADLVAA